MTRLLLGLPWIFPMPQFSQLLIFIFLPHPYCSKLLHIYLRTYMYIFFNVAGHKQYITPWSPFCPCAAH